MKISLVVILNYAIFNRMEVIPQLERSLAAAELLNNKEKHLLISEKLAEIQN